MVKQDSVDEPRVLGLRCLYWFRPEQPISRSGIFCRLHAHQYSAGDAARRKGLNRWLDESAQVGTFKDNTLTVRHQIKAGERITVRSARILAETCCRPRSSRRLPYDSRPASIWRISNTQAVFARIERSRQRVDFGGISVAISPKDSAAGEAPNGYRQTR